MQHIFFVTMTKQHLNLNRVGTKHILRTKVYNDFPPEVFALSANPMHYAMCGYQILLAQYANHNLTDNFKRKFSKDLRHYKHLCKT